MCAAGHIPTVVLLECWNGTLQRGEVDYSNRYQRVNQRYWMDIPAPDMGASAR